MAWNIVIAGGGFGGLFAARALERTLPPHAARITLVDDANFMVFTSLLPGAAGGTRAPARRRAARRELERTEVRLGHVTGADPERKRLLVRCPEAGGGGDGLTSFPTTS